MKNKPKTSPDITWTTKEGDVFKLSQMTDTHLLRTIDYLKTSSQKYNTRLKSIYYDLCDELEDREFYYKNILNLE